MRCYVPIGPSKCSLVTDNNITRSMRRRDVQCAHQTQWNIIPLRYIVYVACICLTSCSISCSLRRLLLCLAPGALSNDAVWPLTSIWRLSRTSWIFMAPTTTGSKARWAQQAGRVWAGAEPQRTARTGAGAYRGGLPPTACFISTTK